MSAETADNAGTPQLKQFHMVNIKTKFPWEYGHGRANLNGPRVAGARSLPASDQVISLTLADGCNGSVHPGPGLNVKRQASSAKLR